MIVLFATLASFAEPVPCHFDGPIGIKTLAQAMSEGCFLPVGTMLTVPVIDLNTVELDEDLFRTNPAPPSWLSSKQVEALEKAGIWLARSSKVAKVGINIYAPVSGMTGDARSKKLEADSKAVIEYLHSLGVPYEKMEPRSMIDERGLGRIDFIVVQVGE